MSGEFIHIITGFIVFFILYTAIYNFIIDKYYRWSKRRTPIKFALAISLITGVITTWALLKI